MKKGVLAPSEQLGVLTEPIDRYPYAVLHDEGQVYIFRVYGNLHKNIERIPFLQEEVAYTRPRNTIDVHSELTLHTIFQCDVLQPDPSRTLVHNAQGLSRAPDRGEHRVKPERVLTE